MNRIHCAVFAALFMSVAPAAWAESELFHLPTAGDIAGTAVDVSGTTAVVGVPGQGGIGAADVYIKDAGNWVFQQRLTPSDGAASDQFGASVSIHGDEIAVGAPLHGGTGAVYTFTRTAGVWSQDATVLVPTNATGPEQYGASVSIEGDKLAVGAPFEAVGAKAAQGVVYAYFNPGSGWALEQKIVERRGNSRAGDHIGFSVGLSGNTIVAGAPDDDFGNKPDRGSIWVYVRNGTVWTKQARLNPTGNAGDRAGAAVAIFSNSAVFGAPHRNLGPNNDQGGAYTYTRTGTNWALTGTITDATGAANDRLGAAVSISGPLKVVGAPGVPGTGNGKAFLFGTGNAPLGQFTAANNAAGDNFGTSVSIDSGRATVGAPNHDTSGNTDAGEGYLFDDLVTSTTTAITNIDPEPSNAGQAYTVSVKVTPTPVAPRTVDVDDGDGAVCSPSITLDLNGEGSCSLTSVAPGPHTITASFTGNDTFSASQGTAPHSVVGGDLAVVKSDNSEVIVAGATNTYNIVVSNPGDFAAVGVKVTDTLPAELTNASWTCTAGIGGVCPIPASGTGDIVAQSVDLLPGASVTFTLTATVVDPLPLSTTFIDNTASIDPGVNADLNTNNNTSTDSDDVVDNALFSDSFEGP